MWDLNRTERKALACGLLLVGTGTLARTLVAPGPGAIDWQPDPDERAGLAGFQAEVANALERERRAQTPLGEGERIDLNRAPSEELRRLPGIGPGLAEAIVRERRLRPFRVVGDLERVPGIGEVTAGRLGPHVDFGQSSGRPPSPLDELGGGCAGRPDAVDVNRATAVELQRLPGVGPAIAGRIVEERMSRGPFEDAASLVRVHGIGPRSVKALADLSCAGRP